MTNAASGKTPREDDLYPPSPDFAARANVPDWKVPTARAGQDLADRLSPRAAAPHQVDVATRVAASRRAIKTR